MKISFEWTGPEARVMLKMLESLGFADPTIVMDLTISPEQTALTLKALASGILAVKPDERAYGIDRNLKALAHRYGISTRETSWIWKTIIRAALEHEVLTNDKPARPVGRPKRSDTPLGDADLHEFWIAALQLQAVMMVRLDRDVAIEDLAEEMARRSLGLKMNSADWSTFQADQHLESAQYYERLLRHDRRKPYESFLKRVYFEIPKSMRENSRVSTHPHIKQSELNWAPSETELMETPEWQPRYRKLRASMLAEMGKRSP